MGATISSTGVVVHTHSGGTSGGSVLAPSVVTITGTLDERQLDVIGVLNQAVSPFRVLSSGTTNPPNPLPVQTAGIRMFQVDPSGTVTVSDTTHTDSVVRFQVRAPSSQAASILQVVRAFAGGNFTAWSMGSTGANVFGDTSVHGKSVVRLQVNQGSTQDVDMVRVRNTAGTVDFVKVDSAGVFSLSAPLAVDSGGTGIAALASGNLPLGAGASAFTALAPGAAGGFVRSDGAAWARATIVDADLPATLTANARIAVSKNSGATVGTRRRINLIEGTNVTMTIADDAGSEEVDVTINSSGGAGGPHNLLSATHTDTLAHTPPARGSLIVGHSSGTAWDELLVGTGFLRATGVASDPAWAAVDLATSDVTGTLAATKGGTGLAAYTTGDMIYSSATNTLSRLTAVAVGKVLISAGVATAPAWGTAPAIGGGTGIDTYVTGDVIYASATNVLSKLAINATPTRYLSSDPSGVTAVSWQPVKLGNGVIGTLPVTSGGTGLTTFSQGDLIYSAAPSSLTALAKNTSATRYLSNTGTSNDPAWAQVNLANGVTGTLPAANIGAHDHSGAAQGGGTLLPTVLTVKDGDFTIQNSASITKQARFLADNQGAGSISYHRLPAIPGGGTADIAALNVVQTWSQLQTMDQVPIAFRTTVGSSNIMTATDIGTGFTCSLEVPISIGANGRATIPAGFGGTIIVVGDSTSDPPPSGEVAKVNRINQVASIFPSVIIANGTATGFYLILAFMSCSVAGSNPLSLNISYTDDFATRSNKTIATLDITSTSNYANTTTVIYKGAGNITWNVSAYISGTYNVRLRVIYLGP